MPLYFLNLRFDSVVSVSSNLSGGSVLSSAFADDAESPGNDTTVFTGCFVLVSVVVIFEIRKF